jgi:hypothetical protein
MSNRTLMARSGAVGQAMVANGVASPMLALSEWLADPETKRKLQLCADAGIAALKKDHSLRVPRSEEDRQGAFGDWKLRWRDRLSAEVEAEFHRQFPGVTDRLAPGTIKSIIDEFVWPEVESTLMSYALRGIANGWVSRNMGDATMVLPPERDGQYWIVPLTVRGHSHVKGQVVLDQDGNLIVDRCSTRQDILDQFDD